MNVIICSDTKDASYVFMFGNSVEMRQFEKVKCILVLRFEIGTAVKVLAHKNCESIN